MALQPLSVVLQDYFNDICCSIVTPSYNFDITADWDGSNSLFQGTFTVTDQASFETFLSSRNDYSLQNNLINIVITDFSLVNGRLQCNLTADGTILDMGGIGATGSVLNIGNVTGLSTLYLRNNQIVTFNPSIALPSSLQYLDLQNNQMTTAGYTASESWGNAQPAFSSTCNVDFGGNINSASGTNLEIILTSKNCMVTT